MDLSHATSTPSIRIYDSGPQSHYSLPRRSSSYASTSTSSVPMAIPNARESPPPPLPPPRYISELSDGHDPGWQWGNSPDGPGFGRSAFGSVKPGSSLLGGRRSSEQTKQDKPLEHVERPGLHSARRGSSMSTIKVSDAELSSESLEHSDEDRDGSRRPSIANFRYYSRFHKRCA